MKAMKDMKAVWWLDTAKRIERIIKENAFDEKKKKSGLKLNPALAPTGFEKLGPKGVQNLKKIKP